MNNEILITIITSATIASLVSGIFLFINEWLRRKSEERRFLLEVALKLTNIKEGRGKELIKAITKRGGKVFLPHPEKTFERMIKKLKEIGKE